MANNPNIIPPNLQEILGGFNRRITSFLTEENEILVDQFLMNNNIIIPANIDQSTTLMVKERFYNIVPMINGMTVRRSMDMGYGQLVRDDLQLITLTGCQGALVNQLVHHFTQENIEATLTLHSEAAETLDRCQARILMLQHQRDVNTQALEEAEELEVLLLDRYNAINARRVAMNVVILNVGNVGWGIGGGPEGAAGGRRGRGRRAPVGRGRRGGREGGRGDGF
ncbi:hypothetical protein P8452_66213 [Trifolium repens]|nr:hypothetical protein P8452_66213 [Trifolium repens]